MRLKAASADRDIARAFLIGWYLGHAATPVFSKTLKTEEERRQLKTLISKWRALNDVRVKVVHGQGSLSTREEWSHMFRRTLAIKDTTEMAKLLEKKTNETLSKFREELKEML